GCNWWSRTSTPRGRRWSSVGLMSAMFKCSTGDHLSTSAIRTVMAGRCSRYLLANEFCDEQYSSTVWWRAGAMAGSGGAAGTAGPGQRQPPEVHADQPQRQGHDGPGSPVAGADTTGGAGQSQPTDDQADQPHHVSHEGPGSPIGDADSAVGEVDGEAE